MRIAARMFLACRSSMFVLDTNTLIYFFKGSGKVALRLLATPPRQVRVPSIVLYELETGIAKSSSPAKRRRQLDCFLEEVELLPFAANEARRAAQIRARLEAEGTPIGPIDVLIAATALACGGTLVTHNLREFQRVEGLGTIDWY